jgi:hypothetical protein
MNHFLGADWALEIDVSEGVNVDDWDEVLS